MRVTLLAVSVSLLLSACAQNTNQYYWGQYENLLYKTYNKPGEATPELQINLLKKDIQQAEATGKPVAPGIYAHLGFMYAAHGQIELAIEALNEEKSLYPDSATLVDGMIKRVQAKQ